MPTPQADETHDQYIERCIPIVLDEGTAEDADQAYAVCQGMWDKAKGVGEMADVNQRSSAEYIREFIVGEFKGDFPDVPIFEGVDLEALKQDDNDPFFVTLPIAEVGETSNNGLLYDDAFVNDLLAQIRENRPTGMRGHLEDEKRSSAYPMPAVYWVGAIRDGHTAWAKGYIPPGPTRDDIRRLKAIKGKAATSVYGPTARRIKEPNGTWHAEGFKLESLDLAPYERAALKLGGQFAVTAEMQADNVNNEQGDEDMQTKDQIVAELTVLDLPDALRQQVVNEWQQEAGNKNRIAELEQQVSERDKSIGELTKQLDGYQTAEFGKKVDAAVSELVKDWKVSESGKAKVQSLLDQVRKQVVAEIGEKRDEKKIAEITNQVWEDLKPLAETVRDALAGPAAFVRGKIDGASRKLEDTPEARAEARSQVGV